MLCNNYMQDLEGEKSEAPDSGIRVVFACWNRLLSNIRLLHQLAFHIRGFESPAVFRLTVIGGFFVDG